MLPLFLDCDPGIDDAVALGYLCCRDDVELIGVAASGGNVSTAQVTTNAQAWLELAGRDDVAVHRGAYLPLQAAQEGAEPGYADDTHGPAGTGHAVLPTPRATSSQTIPHETGTRQSEAAQAWVEAARAHPGQLIGVVTGPCTNLALALELEPELPQLLRRLFIMGGAFNYRGNTKPTSEWNIDFDPEAAADVFSAFSHAPQLPVIGPIEATESIQVTPELFAEITTSPHHSARWATWLNHLAEALRFYFEFHASEGLGYLAQVHDPLVVAAAVEWGLADRPAATSPDQPDPHTTPIPWAETAEAAIDVELTGTLTRGETVADWMGRWNQAPTAELIRRLDAPAFLTHLKQTLLRGPSL